MQTVDFTTTARNEYVAAAQWHERQRSGLGVRFFETVDKFIADIAKDPLRYPVIRDDVRESFVDEFPYYVYYRVEADQVNIVAIVHGSRDPSVWLSRVKAKEE